MIKVEDREKIRRAYFVDKKSQRQIARELGCSRDSEEGDRIGRVWPVHADTTAPGADAGAIQGPHR